MGQPYKWQQLEIVWHFTMVFLSRGIFAVFKTTGGKLWNKPWGIPKTTRTQKGNKRKNKLQIARNLDALRLAKKYSPENCGLKGYIPKEKKGVAQAKPSAA